jgi:hypothetical protein
MIMPADRELSNSTPQDAESARLAFDRWKSQEELKLQKDELELKRRESARSRWSSPILVASIGLFATLLGNLVQNIIQSAVNRDLERQRFESTLIQKAVETASSDEAAKRLQFLVNLGFVRDESGRIAKYVAAPESIPLQPLASAPQGDDFIGVRRIDAKLSIAVGPIENFSDLKSLLASLPTDSVASAQIPKSGRSVVEERNVRVQAFIYAGRWQESNDISLIVGPKPGAEPMSYMNAMVSGLPPKDARFFGQIKSVRDAVKSFFGDNLPGKGYIRYAPPIPVEIEGSLFFNNVHPLGSVGPPGFKKGGTRWEIDPITKIVFKQDFLLTPG